ncbi:type I glyceraldehyde-3-phosphate dehydrogenase [Actinopolymorpha alba]|uniref:type I glyceraldehyde-3-phosphate dehydrogenase n=1 Tax=Actinopolymorpha alba TaxID=533267 RepID=UPI00036A1968|nr:type I glyceraldehyde-3-phosphate dehydrogenase [Actinopolymorpha alba]
MPVRVGVNGFGRIGRNFLRCALERDMEVVAINDVAPINVLAHLLAYDSTYGRLHFPVRHDDKAIYVDRTPIAVSANPDPARLSWGELGVDVVIESTGRFRARDDAAGHLKAGARKVLISAPGKDVDLTVVFGVNEGEYDDGRHDVISNASCTTNCVVPMVKVLHEAFGVVKGFMSTVHGYTNDQVLLDAPHKDLHRARSGAVNIIPTSTGAARSIGVMLPELDGRLDGVALRVPVEDGSLTDLTVILERPVSVGEVNAVFRRAADESLSGIVRVTSDPIVSRDIVGEPASCVFDMSLTQVNGELAKVFGWYDNEWGYSNRLADLAEYVGHRL